jgi:twitching motility protein PilT
MNASDSDLPGGEQPSAQPAASQHPESFDPGVFPQPFVPLMYPPRVLPVVESAAAPLETPVDSGIPIFDSGIFDVPAFPTFEETPTQSPAHWDEPAPAGSAPAVTSEGAGFMGRRAERERAQMEAAAAAVAQSGSSAAVLTTAERSYGMPDASAGDREFGGPITLTRSPFTEVLDLGSGVVGTDPDLVAALNIVVALRASDLHVSVDAVPMLRIDGGLDAVPGLDEWNADKVTSALHSIMSPEHRAQFEKDLELDFAYTLSAGSRFRVNVYQQRGSMGAAFRLISTEIKSLAGLGIPEKIGNFAKLARGLVLVTGPTGSGKSTTLAALIDIVNSTRSDHIVTVEDPIEFMHTNKKSLVNQREVGHDTHSFANALKHVLRQDPDVILIGELRDLETISVALTAAETGHLVFATLHTQDAAQTIDRIIDVFPPHQQSQIRAQLAATLQGVVCQTLVKKVGGGGRAVATEVLMTTSAVSNLIREGKTFQIHSVMQAGKEAGMHTLDQHLAELVDAGQISHAAAYEKAHDIEDLKQLIQRAGQVGGADKSSTVASNGIDFGDSY